MKPKLIIGNKNYSSWSLRSWLLLKEAGIGGTVRVYFFISDEGTVLSRLIDQSSGNPALDDAAMAVADVYRFRPAENRGTRVPVWVSFPITFQVK